MPNRNLLKSRLKASRGNRSANRLVGAATIGFSLTFVAAGVAMLLGFVPERVLAGFDNVDATVVLLFVPLCALTLAILAEAVRTSLTGTIRQPARAERNLLEPWRPGRGEG